MDVLESQIAEWRAYVGRSRTIGGPDVDELEAHLRDQMADLGAGGLSADEAFLVAVKRMGDVDGLSREFALEHSERLWKQLVLPARTESHRTSNGLIEALVLAVAAAVAIQIALRGGGWSGEPPPWFLRNVSLFVLPFLAWYFVQRRKLPLLQTLLTAAPFVLGALAVNLYPFRPDSSTEVLVALHLPVALWFAVGYAYVGGEWRSRERRMDYVRFSGEWFIYYVLVALGGGVLMGLTLSVLEPVRAGLGESVIGWVLPSGAAGAVIVAAWLVEAKQSVVENMAPVLTMVFTPLFALMLTGSALVYAVTGLGGDFDREQLVVFDALLIVVLGLVLYGLSARESTQRAGLMDRIQLVAVAAALVLDVMVLASMLARIGDLGFTPNRVAALGLNLVLFLNLTGAAWLSIRLFSGRATFHRLAHWQTTYLPIFGLWAAIVVVLLPPLFSFA
ncbi:MAG TPA: permease prefix domain 1-containing protein [Thermoleophilia bacterium]|nr:permease prefix domain 1-containing protein [Thermoleophilia bacterium]